MRAISLFIAQLEFVMQLYNLLLLRLSFLIAWSVLSSCQFSLGPLPQSYNAQESCAAGSEFYNAGNLSCVACGTNQRSSSDDLSCSCRSGYYRPPSPGISAQCTFCGNNLVTSRDGLYCLQCLSSGFNSQTNECNSCPFNTQIFVDDLPSNQSVSGKRMCEQCPPGLWADSSQFNCVPCGLTNCSQCVVSNGVCFSSPLPSLLPPPTEVFQFYSDNFGVAVELCRSGNVTACQLLANLCVLQRYSPTDPACDQSMQLAGDSLPPIFYPSQSADEWLERDDISLRLDTSAAAQSTLPLVVASFSLNGTFLGLTDVDNEIVLCGERPSRLQSAWRVGVLYHIQCSISVTELASQFSTPVFYDLFLRDSVTSGSSTVDRLYPVAVLPSDFMDRAGELVNQMTSDPRQWQLVRRFFLAEAVSNEPRYARGISLIVPLNTNGRIFPPYLKIEYASWSPNSPTSNQLLASYSTEYVRMTFDFTIGLCVTLSVLAVGVAVYTGFRINGFLRRSGQLCCHIHTFVLLVVEFGGGLSTAIFLLLTIASTFWLIFYKAQTTFFFALPTGTDELAFKIFLGVALLFRLLHIVYQLWLQCTIDVFFIDWERPRGVLLTSSQPVGANQATPTTATAPVSIWRTYFVANEWNEIQSITKINHTLLLCLVLLFGQVVGLEHLAEWDPSSHVTTSESRYSAPFSAVLRFSITSLHFIIVAVILRLFVFLIYERFFEHKIRQFVDLCSVSNVSVFVMSRKLYGFYIHGRSVHGHADTDMREMNQNLFKERENMCGHRGLELDSDLQVYEISLTQQFRNHYEKIFSQLSDNNPTPAGVANRRDTSRSSGDVGVSEATLKAYQAMNQFLSSFIERSLQGVNYVIKDKLLPEKIFDMEFFSSPNMSTFYRDPGFNFDSLLFYGSGWTLFQFDLLVFAVVDLLAESYVLAAVITFIVAWSVRMLRDTLGRRNLGKKTLVDERFLI